MGRVSRYTSCPELYLRNVRVTFFCILRRFHTQALPKHADLNVTDLGFIQHLSQLFGLQQRLELGSHTRQASVITPLPGACFLKVPRPFRARKSSCQTAIRFFGKADLL